MPIFRRVGDLLIGWIGGYFGAAETMAGGGPVPPAWYQWAAVQFAGSSWPVWSSGVETSTTTRILRWFFTLRSGKEG